MVPNSWKLKMWYGLKIKVFNSIVIIFNGRMIIIIQTSQLWMAQVKSIYQEYSCIWVSQFVWKVRYCARECSSSSSCLKGYKSFWVRLSYLSLRYTQSDSLMVIFSISFNLNFISFKNKIECNTIIQCNIKITKYYNPII